MTALEYVMPQSGFYKYDCEDYCLIDEICLESFIKGTQLTDRLYDSRCELLKIFTTDLYGSYIMDKDTRDKLDALEISFDEGTMDWNSFIQYPYYRIRGKKVTEEQAAEIIDSILETYDKDDEDENKICFMNLNHPVKPDGSVGENRITAKWPDINEMIQDVLQLKLRFPYLEFILAVSTWNGHPLEAWESKLFESDFINGELREYENFSTNLQIGIWVHDNKIEILNEHNAGKKYDEYDRLYSDKDLRKYILE